MARRTRAERRLIEHLKGQFGEHLSALLLSGHGVKEWDRRRDLVISTTDRVGNQEERSVVLLTAGVASLPYGQDPLVLAAHLRRLDERGAAGRLSYDLFEMMKVIGWVDPLQGLKAVEGALFRYFSLSYAAVGKRRHPMALLGEGVTADAWACRRRAAWPRRSGSGRQRRRSPARPEPNPTASPSRCRVALRVVCLRR